MGVVCIRIEDETWKCDTILFPKGDIITEVNVTRIPNNDHRELKPLIEFSQPEEKTVNGLPQRNYSFVFNHDHENRIDFVIGPTHDKSFTRLYFRFAPNRENGFDVLEHFTNEKEIKDIERTTDFNMDKVVIGIWYQSDYFKKPDYMYEDFGHIVLLKDNQLVFWCRRRSNYDQVQMSQKAVINISV